LSSKASVPQTSAPTNAPDYIHILNSLSHRAFLFGERQEAEKNVAKHTTSLRKVVESEFGSERRSLKYLLDQAKNRASWAEKKIAAIDQKLLPSITGLLEKQNKQTAPAEVSGAQLADLQKAAEAALDKKFDQKYGELEAAVSIRLEKKMNDIESAMTQRHAKRLREQDDQLARRFDEKKAEQDSALERYIRQKMTELEASFAAQQQQKSEEQNAAIANVFEQERSKQQQEQAKQQAEKSDLLQLVNSQTVKSNGLAQAVEDLKKAVDQSSRSASDTERQLSHLKDHATKQLSTLKEDTVKQMSAMKGDTDRQLSNLKADTTKQLSELSKDTTRNVSQLTTEFDNTKLRKLEDQQTTQARQLADLRSQTDQFEIQIREIKETRPRFIESPPASGSMSAEQLETRLLIHYKDLRHDISKLDVRIEKLEQAPQSRASSISCPDPKREPPPPPLGFTEPEIRALVQSQVQAEGEQWKFKFNKASELLDTYFVKAIGDRDAEMKPKLEQLKTDLATIITRMDSLETAFQQAQEALKKTEKSVDALEIQTRARLITDEEIKDLKSQGEALATQISTLNEWQNGFQTAEMVKQMAVTIHNFMPQGVQTQINYLMGRVVGLENQLRCGMDQDSHKRRKVSANGTIMAIPANH
jgi:hypothetical protein